MQQSEVGDLDETVGMARHEEIYIAKATERIIRIEPAEGVEDAISLSCHSGAIQDVLGAAGTTDGDDHVARPRMPFELFGEHELIAKVVAETGQDRSVI